MKKKSKIQVGMKFDNGKEPLDLIPYEALKEIAKVLDFGGKKYNYFNWLSGIQYRRLISAAFRHINKFNSGENIDDETKTNHLANAICSLMFILHYESNKKLYKKFDDRGFKRNNT